MIDISYQNNPDLYFDYRLGLNLLRTINEDNYSYPDEVVNFHVYTEVKTEKELECIKSYLATQNLEKTKKLQNLEKVEKIENGLQKKVTL